MTNKELINVRGGATSTYTSAAFINAIARGIGVLYDLGKSVGSTLKIIISGKKCS